MSVETKHEIESLLKELQTNGYYLTTFGLLALPATDDQHAEFLTESSVNNIKRAMLQIPYLFRIRKTFYRLNTSYGLKHMLESYRLDNEEKPSDYYIANGTFIIAMILSGFKYKRTHHTSPNVFFNVSVIA